MNYEMNINQSYTCLFSQRIHKINLTYLRNPWQENNLPSTKSSNQCLYPASAKLCSEPPISSPGNPTDISTVQNAVPCVMNPSSKIELDRTTNRPPKCHKKKSGQWYKKSSNTTPSLSLLFFTDPFFLSPFTCLSYILLDTYSSPLSPMTYTSQCSIFILIIFPCSIHHITHFLLLSLTPFPPNSINSPFYIICLFSIHLFSTLS